jgi:hypothetical protein
MLGLMLFMVYGAGSGLFVALYHVLMRLLSF